MAEVYPTFLAGQKITAALLTSGQAMTARKTADTQRASTTTATADPHLQFEVSASAVYIWWGWIKYDAPSGSGDITVDFSAPSGALGEWTGIGVGVDRVIGSTDSATPALTVDTQASTGYMVRVETSDVTTARNYGGLGTAGSQLTVTLNGTLRTSTTAGTFSLDWAQRVSNATNTTVYTDSWLCMLRVA